MSLHFVTGKGGVGKTRISLMLAAKMAREKDREKDSVALSELTDGLEEEASKLENYSISEIHKFSREVLGEEFLKTSLRIPFLANWISQSRIFQSLFQLAPNLYELLLLKKWLKISESTDLIVDAPATGHFLALLESAQTAEKIFDGGSLHRLAEEIIEKFEKPGAVVVHLVSIPEISALEESDIIAKNLQTNYPAMKIFKILNRRHLETFENPQLSLRLQEISKKRNDLEVKRISNRPFDFVLPEGAQTL